LPLSPKPGETILLAVSVGVTQPIPTPGKVPLPLNDTWPAFLDRIDRDPQRAWEEFHAFAWKLTRLRPPAVLSSLTPEDREDVLAEIVQDFQKDDFRLLRSYQDRGRPFAAWLWRVVKHRALDRLKAMKTRQHEAIPIWVTDPAPLPAEEIGSKAALDTVRRLIKQLSPRCQILLLAAAEGYKPKDLLDLGSLPYTDNKKLADHLKNCRRSLIKALEREGYTVDDFLDPRS
jgi:DNA-directed RNA polymerase specialized sigma24 family protein